MGLVLALGAYFGEASGRLLDRLLSEQLVDGGWNCMAPPSTRSSFHTTICVLEGSFPTHWHYDILWGLDSLRRANVTPDARIAEAIALVEAKRDSTGRWPLDNPHAGATHVEMEEGGQPSRWITLRALRALRWHARHAAIPPASTTRR